VNEGAGDASSRTELAHAHGSDVDGGDDFADSAEHWFAQCLNLDTDRVIKRNARRARLLEAPANPTHRRGAGQPGPAW